MSILAYNGGAVVGMVGKDCVAVASDMRLGEQAMTIAADFSKVVGIGDKCYLGLTGLATDVQTVARTVKFHANLFKLRESRDLTPHMVTNLMGELMYSRRFGNWLTFPIVAGLNDENQPQLFTLDCIGGVGDSTKEGFVCAGTAADMLLGTCESMYRPNMTPEELKETIAKCLTAAVERDCYSGWGAEVTMITPEGVTVEKVLTRMD